MVPKSPRDGGGGGGNGKPTPSKANTSAPGSNGNTSTNQPLCPGEGANVAVGNDQNGATTHPVILATGEKFEVEQDIVAGSAYGLGLTRTFKTFEHSSLFGVRWMSTYDYGRLGWSGCFHSSDYPGKCIPTSVVVSFTDGSSYTYSSLNLSNGFTYTVAGSSLMGTLSYDPDFGYTLQTPDLVYTWSTAGYIQSVTTVGGVLLQQYNYGSSPSLPNSVTNAAGQTISFTYNSNHYVATVTDPAGNVWTYGYNGNNLTSVTSPGSSADVRTYYYERPDLDYTLLTGIAINGTRYSTYTYDGSKRVASSSLAGGEVNDQFSYGTNQTTLTDAKGEATTFTFTPAQGALKLSGQSRAATSTCGAAAAQTAYDGNGWPSYALDWNGNRTNYSYDAAGKLLQKTVAVGTSAAATQVNTWNGDYLAQSTYKDANGNAYASVSYTYVTSGFGLYRIASVTWNDLRTGAQRQTSYAYTFYSSGILASTTVTQALPGETATTTYAYDSLGNLASVTNALGQQTTYANYNGLGQPGSITNIAGVSTTYVYNPQGTVASTTVHLENNGIRTTTYTYDHNRQPTQIAYADGSAVRYVYDAAEKLQHVGNALGEYIDRNFNVSTITSTPTSARNVPSASGGTPVANSAGSFTATHQLDSLGRPYVDSGNGGQHVQYAYDNNGNLTTRTDAAGHVTTYAYDAADRLVRLQAPDNGVTTFGYNAEGRLAFVTDPRALTTAYTYNGLGQVLTQASPDTGTTTYTYDSAGRPATQAYANGVTITYGWDKLGRPTSRSSAGTTETFTYDQGSYGAGHLSGMSDITGQTTYTYDAAGELTSQTQTVANTTFTTYWAYNQAGSVIGMVYSTGFGLAYNYDSYGRLSNVLSNLSGAWSLLADSFLYEPATNRPYAWRNGNNLPTLTTLDTDGRIGGLQTPGVHDIGFGYTSVDTLGSRTDHLDSAFNASYAYDPADRLTSVANGADPQSFNLDPVGNRTAQSRQGIAYSYTLASTSNQLTGWSGNGQSRSFTYDASGVLASESGSLGNRTYTYDAFLRMTNVLINGSGVGDYRSNALGQRTFRGSLGVATRYGYDPAGELLYEVGPDTTSYVWIAGQLLGLARGNAYYASHNDPLGRPEVLTDVSGTVVWKAVNTPFDRTVTTNTIGDLNVGLPGQYYDSESGLWYNGYRYYDASLGRYLQSDPIGLAGGLNTYTYVAGNPLSGVDPLGLWRLPDYASVQIDVFVFSASATFTVYGDVFLGKGVNRAYPSPLSGGVSISSGWLAKACSNVTPSRSDLNNFLDGWSAGGGGYIGIGGSVSKNLSGTGFNIGVGAGGFSVTAGIVNSYQGNVFGDSWK